MLKKFFCICLSISFLTGCAQKTTSVENNAVVTESTVQEVQPDVQPKKVITLGSSLTDIWINAGGEPIGATSDAFENSNLSLDSEKVSLVGTIKDPNIEIILSLQPDIVLLSPDIQGHTDIIPTLEKSDIDYYSANIDNFDDYLALLKDFTEITGRQDLYEANGLAVQNKIDEVINNVPNMESPRVLFLRASSSNVKSIAKDHFVCEIMNNLNTINIAEKNNAILEELTTEAIIMEDPDYIFVVTMGSDSEAAMASLEQAITSNPAWNDLSAVRNDRFVVLPKELFHNKPNASWGEAYEYLFEVIYAETGER